MELIGPYLVACVLLVAAGVAKAVQPGTTARAVADTVPLPLAALTPLVRVGAAAEGLVGIAGLVYPSPVTAGLVAVSYFAFASYVVFVLVRGGPLASCGCFGTPDTPATRMHVVVNALLALAATVVTVTLPAQSLPAILAVQPWHGVPLVLLCVLGAYLAYLTLGRLAELGAARTILGITRGSAG